MELYFPLKTYQSFLRLYPKHPQLGMDDDFVKHYSFGKPIS